MARARVGVPGADRGVAAGIATGQGGVARRAAVLGLVSYATYDLTNLATIKDCTLVVTVVAMAWGTILGAVVGCIGYLVGRWLS